MTPTNNAVSGSNAPRMAAGVAPMFRMAFAMVTMDIRDGNKASPNAFIHCVPSVSHCKSIPPRRRTI